MESEEIVIDNMNHLYVFVSEGGMEVCVSGGGGGRGWWW